ncbi:hypothetical protein C3Y98_00875 [Methylotenera oryzisoli]|jgi:hypothetical protein|uniref:Uncharacterized protein n=1 Tax=Methylotenera oryzisoli TaxID=2080758 RepID=A0A4Y9VV85_9PROT|nr:hypothetical protein [Methylotenera oryzisoli]TFW72945.1 hypothetical protein C3Y98_00875 [Methylotenera oryzisoli]
MVNLVITFFIVISAFYAPTKTAITVGLAVAFGFIVQLITGFIARPVSLPQSIRAVFFSFVAMFIAALFSVQVLVSTGAAFTPLSFVAVIAASCAAFSICLEIKSAHALVVTLLFWGIAYPTLSYFGVTAFRATA